MTTTLHRLNKSVYEDQYGFEHECYLVIDTVEVTRSEEYFEYEYYTEKVKNWYWDSEDGRRWMCHTQTDFGGSSSWSRRVGEERIKDEHWIRDDRKPDRKDQPHWHGRTPVVFEREHA